VHGIEVLKTITGMTRVVMQLLPEWFNAKKSVFWSGAVAASQ